ncbi:ABC transporter substrate-binding protein [Brevibacillus fortis]|uniref:ABC transporter substrate-binding protein n=1 Tax=Brevibacillus fortis TaxID=2126352 RepID=A0A2P7VP94_9BACL|nr:ABC transporter substrate-binding protein [Brevibacillus fortis]PSK01028.1 ABC transporter substrate-binding protein [Brevibacillus fortis]
MKKKGKILFLILVVAGTLLDWSSSQQKQDVDLYTIGMVIANEDRKDKVAGLKAGLQSLGLGEGARVQYVPVYLNAVQTLEEEHSLVQELISKKPDVIVTTGAHETFLTQKATTTVPIVFIGVASLVELPLVETEGTVTCGISNGQMNVIGKRLELTTRLLPDAKRILIIADSHAPTTEQAIVEAGSAAALLGIRLQVKQVSSPRDLEQLLSELSPGEYDAMLPLPSYVLEDAITDCMPLLIEKQLFVMGSYPEQVKAGLYAAYGVSFHAQGMQAAHMVARVLDGVPPTTLSIEWPDDVRLAVNASSLSKLPITVTDQQWSLAQEWYGVKNK